MKLGYKRLLTPDWFGINSQNSMRDGIWIADSNVLAHIPQLHPKVIRFPGSDVANWWDWKKGWVIDDPRLPDQYAGLTPMQNTLENYKIFLTTCHASSLFVLNMITSNLQYQIGMLKHADSIGIPIKYIELGSEYYLSLEDSGTIFSVFPTAESYGTACTQWIDSIHHYFPKAKIAAQGAFNRSGPIRRLTWDTSMIKTLSGENAISYHHYYNASATENNGYGDGLYTMSDIPEFMYRPFKGWNILRTQDLPTVRKGREVWITEYNLQDTQIPVHGSWGHGLFVAAQSLLYLESTLIRHVYFYCMDGAAYGAYFYNEDGLNFGQGSMFVPPPDPPVTTPWSLSAAGRAIEMIGEVVNLKTAASPLSFKDIPNINVVDDNDSVSYPAIYGWQFSNNTSSAAIIVNLSGFPYQFSTTSVFPGGGNYEMIYANPISYIAGDTDMIQQTGNLSSKLILSPYSITKITSSYVPPPAPSVKIHAAGPTVFCIGDSVQLDGGQGYLSYLWSTGETTRKIWAKNTSAYWVRVWKTTDGYYAVDTMHVTANPHPDLPVIKNPVKDIFCNGDSVVLSLLNTDASLFYQWSNGLTGSALSVHSSGTYYVTATTSAGCSITSAGKTISTYPSPQPVITPSSPINICSGKNTTLATTLLYKNYTWSNNKHTATIKVSIAGSYSVTVTDSNKCSATSSTVSVNVHTVPIPTITIVGPTSFCTGTSPTYLSANAGYLYQWKKGSTEIAGATNRRYYPSETGSFSVIMKDYFGCSQISGIVNISVISCKAGEVGQEIDASMTIYPNPASNFIHIVADFHSGESGLMRLEIRNMLGELVYSEENRENTSSYSADIPLGEIIPEGVYFAKLVNEGQHIIKKFVVTRRSH